MAENTWMRTSDRDGEVEEVMDRIGEKGSRSCGVPGYCQWPVYLEEVQAKKKKMK